ncbi:MAG TPA: hypothetical protein VMU82_07925 [Acetobacteraceae bacterium]|nr:hypothetical protein [Acetobacteraceae bacterium]
MVGALPAREQTFLDLVRQHRAAPAVLDRLAGMPGSLLRELDGLQQADVMTPGELCNNRLHHCAVGPGLGEGPPVFQVARREAGHVREIPAQVTRQPVNDAGSPPRRELPAPPGTAG